MLGRFPVCVAVPAVCLLLLLSPLPAAHAGPLLDEILNCPRLGAHTPGREEDAALAIPPGGSLGQTFRLSPDAEKVFRIALWQAFWHESWEPDEILVLTLWDSLEKKNTYGRYALPYDRRMWESAVPMFTVDARVPAGELLYFELTVDLQPLRPAEEPTEWKLNKSRPGILNGNRGIEGFGGTRRDDTEGTAYVNGQPVDRDLWFEIHEKRRVDRDALHAEAFARFDLEPADLALVRTAVEQKDWDTAAAELVRHFEGRADLFPDGSTTVQFDPDYDTREADLAAAHLVLLDDGITVDLGPEWNHLALWPERGGVGLTRSGLRKHLAGGYRATGNSKYARAWNDMLTHFFLQAPSPVRAGVLPREGTLPPVSPPGLGGGSIWTALSVGARMGHGFYYYGAFVDSPHFTPDVRAAFLFNLGEMSEVFERQRGGGNWDAQMSNGLMEFGLTYPEFKSAPGWVEQGFEQLVNNALESVYDDGAAREPTVGYHGMMMRRYRNVLETAAELDLEVPPRVRELTERMYEFIQHTTQPDGTLVPWGDSTPGSVPFDLIHDATFFHRPDFLYVGTGGAAGTPPAMTSRAFPHGGFYYLRTGWDRRAHFAAVRCGPFGSHGHFDALSLVLSSFGRPILIDPAITTYGTPEAEELTSTAAHNTITVDGRNARSGTAGEWVTTERYDYFRGQNDGYDGLREVCHERRVWFVKPDGDFAGLWLVRDRVAGPGEHEAVLRWRFGRMGVEQHGNTLRTTGDGGNLTVEVLGQAPDAVEEKIARVPGEEGLTTTPVASWKQHGALPLEFTTLLVPWEGEAATHTITKADGPSEAWWIETGNTGILLAEPVKPAEPAAAGEEAYRLPDGMSVSPDGTRLVQCYQLVDGKWTRKW